MKRNPGSGYADAVFIRVYKNEEDLEPQGIRIKRIRYTHSEDEDEACEIEIETDDRNLPSQIFLQEKAIWTLVWGYLGGDVRKRKVILEDVNWKYANTITASIRATELGAILKKQHSKKVYTNTNLLDVAQDAAETNGLNLVLDLDLFPERIKDKPNFIIDDVQLNAKGTTTPVREPLKREFERKRVLESMQKRQRLTQAEKQALRKYNAINKQLAQEIAKRTSMTPLPSDPEEARKLIFGSQKDNPFTGFKQYEAVAQAGKSTRQVIDELAAKEPGGPVVVETRDDKLIVRKRNFGLKPYRTFEFGGDTSELLEFTPESKNKSNASVAYDYEGWDKTNKTFHQGTANGITTNPDNDPVLGAALQFKQNVEELKKLGDKSVYGIKDPNDPKGPVGVPFIKGQLAQTNQSILFSSPNTPINDNPMRPTQFIAPALINLDEENKHIDNLLNPKVPNPEATDAESSFAKAENLRSQGELEKNPATARIIGDPNIEVGMIITIIHVAKKHMGNYYVSKVSEELDSTGGYITTLEMFRHGHNIPIPNVTIPAEVAGKQNNKLLGDTASDGKKVKINVVKN